MNLTSQQLESVQHGEPMRFVDSELGQEFVVVRADVFDRVRLLFDDSDLAPNETLPLIWQSMKDDWEVPAMDVYDNYPMH